METMEELFGEVIYAYTRAQAIEDGFLVDVTEDAKQAGFVSPVALTRDGKQVEFVVPVALTRAAYAELVEWNDNNAALQDEAGRLWDVLNIAWWYASGGKGQRRLCEVLRVPNTPRATVPRKAQFVLHCGPGDHAEPVLTIMLPGED
jgi:hypothetical protein